MSARITVRRSRAARFARICGALSVPVFVLTALGQRFSVIPEISLLALISTGIVLGIVACAFGTYALVHIWKSGDIGAGSAILAMVYSIPGVVLFAATVYALAVFPKLNDITTDAANPPQFLVLDEGTRRIGMPTEDERGLQAAAYPDIAARLYPVGIERVFEAAHRLVDQRGWTIVRQRVPAIGAQEVAIHAVARTMLFRFPDQIVIRIRAEPGGTRVDIRSASEVGHHDLGQNARRIRRLLADFDSALQGERSELQSANR